MSGVWLGLAVLGGATIGAPAVIVSMLLGSLQWYLRQWSSSLWIAVVLATMLGAARGGDAARDPRSFPAGSIDAVRGAVGVPYETRGSSQSFDLSASELRIDGHWQQVDLRLYVTASVVPAVGRGDEIYAVGSFEPTADVAPGFREYLASSDVDGSGFARRMEIDEVGDGWRRSMDDVAASIRDRLQAAAPGDRGALLSGLVTGDDARLSPDRMARFVRTGTTHLTAVSGANLALLLLIAGWIGSRTGMRRKFPWQVVTAMVIWAYAILVGMEPPVIRAAIVATFALGAGRTGRKPDFVTLIVIAAALEVLIWPEHRHRLAFQLSVVSSLALALALAGRRPRGVAGWLGAALITVCAAQVATLAIIAPTFGSVSLTSILANVLVAPVASLTFAVAVIASAAFVLSATLGAAIATLAGLGSEYIIAVVDFMGGSNYATVNVDATGAAGRLLLAVGSIGGVAAMSSECRGAVDRWWRTAKQNQETVAVSAVGVVVGTMLGIAVAGWI